MLVRSGQEFLDSRGTDLQQRTHHWCLLTWPPQNEGQYDLQNSGDTRLYPLWPWRSSKGMGVLSVCPDQCGKRVSHTGQELASIARTRNRLQAQADFSNSCQSSCLSILSAEMTGGCHYNHEHSLTYRSVYILIIPIG